MFFSVTLILMFSLGINAPFIFADSDVSIEIRLAEQNKLAEKIRDNFILILKNPYNYDPQIPITSIINNSDDYTIIKNFKINNIK